MKSIRKSLGGGSSLPPTSKGVNLPPSQQTSPKVIVGNHMRNSSSIQRNTQQPSTQVLLQSSSSQNVEQLSGRNPSQKQQEKEPQSNSNEQVYKAFRNVEDDKLSRSSVLLAKVFYMLDHKQISYKLECEIDYLMTFLSKKDDLVRADTLTLLNKLCVNQEVQTAIMKEQNFHYLVEQCQINQSEEVRSLCYKIFGSISSSKSKQAIKQLLYQAKIIQMMTIRLQKETSEDVICSIILFLQKITSEDIYLELLTQDMDIIHEILGLLNYRKNQRVRKLAFGILINLLRIDEMRKIIMKWPKLDVLAKLITMLQKPSNDLEDTVLTLKALTNAIQDYTIMVSFLQQKGHVALANIFETDNLNIKEVCLAMYQSLAQQRAEQTQGSAPLMTVVLDSELISDVLSLTLNSSKNIAVIRNMLILIQIMLLNKNETAIEQFKGFDIIGLLTNIITGSMELSYLGLSTLALITRLQQFQSLITSQEHSLLHSINAALLSHHNSPSHLRLFLRGLHLFLLSFMNLNGGYLQLDQVLTLIQTLKITYEVLSDDPTGQYYVIVAFKRLGEMENRQVSLVVQGIEQFAQQIEEAPSINRGQMDGIAMDLIDKDIAQHMKYYETADLELSGMNQQVLFYSPPSNQISSISNQSAAAKDHLNQELTELKAKQQTMSLYISDLEHQNSRLNQEVHRLASLSPLNKAQQETQTDVIPQQTDDQTVSIKKLKEEYLMQNRLRQDAEAKNEYMADRITELEQDLVIRDRALQKLTQGTQMAECIGEVKERIREDIKSKFDSYKSTIKTLESVIDTNSKLIKDLTEAVQDKNIQNQALTNEDKLKQGKISQMASKQKNLEALVTDLQAKETQYKMQLQQLIFQNQEQNGDKTSRMIDLPALQLSTEQLIISELQEKMIQIKCDNLQLQEDCSKAQSQLTKLSNQNQSMEIDLNKLKSQLNLGSNPTYVIKSIQKDPKNLDLTLQNMNEALQYIDKTITRHNYKEELCNFYEDRISRLTDRYEQLLLQHSTTLSNYHFCKLQLSQTQNLLSSDDSLDKLGFAELLAQQWQHALKQMSHIEELNKDMVSENKQLKLRLEESESQLVRYKKVVVFDQKQYEKMFRLKNEMPLSRGEDQVLFFFSQNHENNEFIRLTKILDILLKGVSELEYELRKSGSDERLKNDYHLIPEQREMELRQYLTTRASDLKVAKLEHHIQLIQEDMNLLEVMAKPGNQTELFLNDVDDLLTRIHHTITSDAFDSTIYANPTSNDTKETFMKTNQMKTTQSAQNLGNPKKKVQTTNLVQQNDGKKPRIANDYNKKIQKVNGASPKLDLALIDHLIREVIVKVSQVRLNMSEEQKLHASHGHDSSSQIQIIKESLGYRNHELIEVNNSLQKILLSKSELANHLTFRDFQKSLSQSSGNSESIQKVEGLLKVNNFIRKKELEARSTCDLLNHQLERNQMELSSLNQDNKRMHDQIKYLQKLIAHQRDQFMKAGISKSSSQAKSDDNDIPDDDIVKYLVQIDELNQKNNELEYMLQSAIQSNIDREKLFRGTEEVIESINAKMEATKAMIEASCGERDKKAAGAYIKVPARGGPESVYERMKAIEKAVSRWQEQVSEQVQELQKGKEQIEAMKPENQTLTSVEHQAKLEKYLNIYSARIQTLSSIIASYQRHFKSLEDQLKDIQGIPNPQAQQQPSTKLIESSRIESLKRMINLKDILIKHQQNEIEYIKKAIIGDKFNELLVYVTAQEKEALQKMRQFDLQVKVIQDYERQCLMTDESEYRKGEEQTYLKIVNAKIEQDLINVKEMFKISQDEISKQTKQDLPKIKNISNHNHQSFRDYFERWLNIVKDLLQSHFDQEKCKGYISALNQEIPILVSIINSASISEKDLDIPFEINMDRDFIDQRFREMLNEKEQLMNQLNDLKERCNFLRSKNQQLQEQNLLMKKFLSTKQSMSESFKEFYQEDLLAENAQLKSKILSLTPYNEQLALTCATLKTQVTQLHEKLLRQDQRSLTEQELFQTLEQTLLDTQKKLLDKDAHLLGFIRSKRDQLFRGGTDKAIEVLLETCEALQREVVQIKEINWQMEMNAKAQRRSIEEKECKVRESKGIIKEYEERMRELMIDNEKLRVMSKTAAGLGSLQGNVDSLADLKSISKEKLVYELGGKDGAQYALKFIDTQAAMKEELNRIVAEMQQTKMANVTLTILAEEKIKKLHKIQEELKSTKLQLRDKEDLVEKLEFENQKLQDDFLVQQQSLDVYVSMAISFQTGDRSNTHAFNKCIENAQTLASLLANAQRQRGFFYQEAMKNYQEKTLTKEKMKVQRNLLKFTLSQYQLQEQMMNRTALQEQITNGIIGRYDREIGMISSYVLENEGSKTESVIFGLQGQADPESVSPKKQPKISAIDSPRHPSLKRGPNTQSKDLALLPNPFKQRPCGTSLHHFILCQLQLNETLSNFNTLQTHFSSLKLSSLLDKVALSHLTSLTSKLTHENLALRSIQHKTESDSSSLKLQNISLSRWCLYLHRPNQFHSTVNDEEQVATLMYQELDKLRIQNKLLADRNDTLELKLYHRGANSSDNNVMRHHQLVARELQQQIDWNQRLELEIISKSTQIVALSKLTTNEQQLYKAQDGDDQHSSMVSLRQEYARLEHSHSQLHQKVYLLETRGTQKDQKINSLTERIRDLEKQMITSTTGQQQHSLSLDVVKSDPREGVMSQREVQLQAEIDEVWRRYSELNDLKNTLYARNEDLRVEVDSFKTHFSKYDALEFKKKLGASETFQNSLYNELTLLREERDLHSWQVAKLMQRVTQVQSQSEILTSQVVPKLEMELRRCEEIERSLEREIGQVREMQVQTNDSQHMLLVADVNRLKQDRVTMRYENSRIMRENESLIKQIQVLQAQNQKLVNNEYQIKKRLIEVKNELVRTKVRDDMGEYNTMITGTKSPNKGQNSIQNQMERVQVYVEDLSVIREQMLKVEFRNIELEELNQKLERESEELRLRTKEQNQQIMATNEQRFNPINDERDLDGVARTSEMLDLHRRLVHERWANQRLVQEKVDLEVQIMDFNAVQERYMEEVNEHQRLHSEIMILKKTISEYHKNQRLNGNDIGDNSDETLNFYDALKEKFLSQLSLYLQDLSTKSRLLSQAHSKIALLEDHLFLVTSKVASFDQERLSYKMLIERITNDKQHQIEQDFVNTQQYEDGMTKLEALIMNQRKKIAHMRSAIDTLNTDKQVMDQNMKGMRDIIRKYERQQVESGLEMAILKGQVVKMRNDAELQATRIEMMWDRLEFQQRVHHKVNFNNVTIEEIVKIYKQEIQKIKAMTKNILLSSTVKNEIGEITQKNISKGELLQMQSDIVRMRNKEKSNDEQINSLNKQLEENKLHIRLAEMLRKTIGVSQLERQLLENKLDKKRDKLAKLKGELAQSTLDRDRFTDRIQFLERQFNLKAGIVDSSGFVKANAGDDRVQELEEQNGKLKQQMQEMMKMQESKTLITQNSQSTIKSIGGASRQARAITPVRIRDMPIKQGNLSQRLKMHKQQAAQNDTVPGEGPDFYYGQDVTIDPMQNYNQGEIMNLNQSQDQNITKLPMIGNNSNYVQQLDLRLKSNARNMTPLPLRNTQSQYSTLSQPVPQIPSTAHSNQSDNLTHGSVTQALRAAGIMGNQPKVMPKINVKGGGGGGPSTYMTAPKQQSLANPNYETVEQQMNESNLSKGYK